METDAPAVEERVTEEPQVWPPPGAQQEPEASMEMHMNGDQSAPHQHNEMNGGQGPEETAESHAAPMTEDGREGAPKTGEHNGRRPYRQREPKPNKVYIGGLPEHTRQEDLQSCFGKLGKVIGIELKLGYGFVEFDTIAAAEEAVAKYHEGFFMGNKIRVELSHGGGRTAKYNNDPGACFKCGQQGHWARECPNPNTHVAGAAGTGAGAAGKKFTGHHGGPGAGHEPLIDRISHPREYPSPAPPPRDYPPYRDDYRDRERYPPPPPGRDDRYGYARPPPPRDGRDYREPRDLRLPPSPPREYRDYPAGPPRREYEYERRGDARGPPPPIPPPSRYEPRPPYYEPGYGPPPASYPPPRAEYPPPPPRDAYPRTYDRRDSGAAPPPPPGDKYYPAAPPPVSRLRSPGPPPARAGRDEYERATPREYVRPPADYRARSPPTAGAAARYPEYAAREPPPSSRYGRRTPSPPRAASAAYRGFPEAKVANGAPAYPPTNGYPENGYSSASAGGPGGPPGSAGRNTGMSNGRERDFAPRSAGATESAGYVRRS